MLPLSLYAMLRKPSSLCAMLCKFPCVYAMLCYSMPCHAMPGYATLCYAMLCYLQVVLLGYASFQSLCYGMPCYAMLCQALSLKLNILNTSPCPYTVPDKCHVSVQTFWASTIEDRAKVDLKFHFMKKTLNEVVSSCSIVTGCQYCRQSTSPLCFSLTKRSNLSPFCSTHQTTVPQAMNDS